jgi:hypothetical protein
MINNTPPTLQKMKWIICGFMENYTLVIYNRMTSWKWLILFVLCRLEKMMDNLNATMDRADDNIPLTEEEIKDCICTAKFPDDDRYILLLYMYC